MSMFKEFAMPPLVLTVIAAVVTGALVATESVTTPIIEQQAAAAAQGCFEFPLPCVHFLKTGRKRARSKFLFIYRLLQS